MELDGKHLVTKVNPARFHRVRQGLRFLLNRKRCSGRALEVLIGHCTYIVVWSIDVCSVSSIVCTSSFASTTPQSPFCGRASLQNSGPSQVLRRSGGHNARESALSSAGFVRNDVTVKWVAGDMDDDEYLEAGDKACGDRMNTLSTLKPEPWPNR